MSVQTFNSQERHAARVSAVQALYQMEISGEGSKLVLREFSDHWFLQGAPLNPEKTDETYFEMIVLGVVTHQGEIDKTIRAKLSEKWKLSRLDTTLRAIMRCACYELLFCSDVPAIVIIAEYVKISEEFFSGPEPKFVNAALEKIAKEHRPHEFGVITPG